MAADSYDSPIYLSYIWYSVPVRSSNPDIRVWRPNPGGTASPKIDQKAAHNMNLKESMQWTASYPLAPPLGRYLGALFMREWTAPITTREGA